jgi:hypothetical protein
MENGKEEEEKIPSLSNGHGEKMDEVRLTAKVKKAG